ncbi:MAG: acyl-CoA dehydratase activase [Syntrophales bacterium]|jgi:predicted CoA-substrate-specific enzyme activase|nr:acyl-CoA dehydratase activase [Syntrophales bacterium]
MDMNNHTVGIDVGSITSKAVLMKDGTILASKVIFTGYNVETAARKVFEEVLADVGLPLEAVGRIVATGYGRKGVSFAHESLTEILCHASGAYYQNPEIRFIIDIGGQDSKAILLDDAGRVKNFTMNDKCAAGTGRFLEVMARAMEVNLEDFGDLSMQADQPSKISSLCTVFAESEVISLISKGASRENIIAGIHESIGARVSAMAKRVGLRAPVMMTGGVAKNKGVVKALLEKLGLPIEVSRYAQVNGAIGAAYLAWK